MQRVRVLIRHLYMSSVSVWEEDRLFIVWAFYARARRHNEKTVKVRTYAVNVNERLLYDLSTNQDHHPYGASDPDDPMPRAPRLTAWRRAP
jgi:hypothetical protein